MRRDLVLPGVACTVCLAALVAAVTHIPVITVPLGILAVLAAPGMVLQQALFPGKTIGTAERVMLTLGLSVVVAVLGGLLLNLTDPGLTPVCAAKAARLAPRADVATRHATRCRNGGVAAWRHRHLARGCAASRRPVDVYAVVADAADGPPDAGTPRGT